MFNKLKQIKDGVSQFSKLRETQALMQRIQVTASDKHQLVEVTVNGLRDITAIKITDQGMQDRTKLETAIVEAVKEAGQALAKEMMRTMTEGGDGGQLSDMARKLGMMG